LLQLAGLAARLSKREAMAARLRLLEDFRTRLAANEAALRAATVTDAVIKDLDLLEQEEETLRARIDAAAARLTIEAGPGSGVLVNGAAVEGHAARAVNEALTITVGSGVTITVSPPAATLAAAEAKLKEQRGRLTALLGEHMAASPAALRQLRASRMRSEDTARDLKAERGALSITETPVAETAKLEAAIGEIDAELQRALATHAEMPAAAAIDAEQQAISARRGELRAVRTRIEAVIDGQNASLERIAKARGTLDGQLREIIAKLETDLALLPDDTRNAAIAEAEAERDTREAAHRGKAALLEEKRSEAPAAEDVERLAARQTRLASALQNRASKIEDLNQQIARLEGEIQTAGGDGLGERAATLAILQSLADAEVARQTERVEVLSLLRSTVEHCYNRRREELNAPLRRHLKPFINDVFPHADIQLGENFAVSGLSRMGPGSEVFGRLSLGTQEQVAVLVRLAMGQMIAEKGAEVPLILDDALVFSDDERIEQMFDAINRAGRRQQVIVLTCRARSFASLGGRQLQILHNEKKSD
jgi:DNA repair exonuclease SbcCD ATPase subunit